MNYYVYGLFVPGCDVPFYIGKGTRRRFRAHIKSYVYDNENVRHNRAMYDMIKEMVESGNSPETRRLAEFDSEDVALDEEYRLINHYGIISEGGILYNIHKTRGGRTGPRHRVITGDELRRRREGFKKKRAIVPTKEELEDLYFTKDMTRRQIADHYDVSQSLVGKLFREFGIKGKTYKISEEHRAAVKRGALKRIRFHFSEDDLQKLLEEHKTANRIAKHLKTTFSVVNNALKQHSLHNDSPQQFWATSEEDIIHLVEDVGIREVARQCGISHGTVYRRIRNLNRKPTDRSVFKDLSKDEFFALLAEHGKQGLADLYGVYPYAVTARIQKWTSKD